jgi:hypothetical protein
VGRIGEGRWNIQGGKKIECSIGFFSRQFFYRIADDDFEMS